MDNLFANVAYKNKNEEIFIRFYQMKLPTLQTDLKEGATVTIPGHTEPAAVKEVLHQYGNANYLLRTIWKNVLDEHEIEHHSEMMFSNGWNIFHM